MVKRVTSNLIRETRLLHQAKHRNKTGKFLAEGEKIVLELLRSPIIAEQVFCLPSFYDSYSELLSGREVWEVNESELSRLSLLQTPNKVVAVAAKPGEKLVDYSKNSGVHLFLDGIRDPGNMGTIIRTSEWFGVKQIICSDDCVDRWNPKVVQGTMGSVFRMDVTYGNLPVMLKNVKEQGVKQIVGAVVGGKDSIKGLSTDEPVVLVIGNESFGISDEVVKYLTIKTGIAAASNSAAESLNAAVACGILLYELAEK